MFYDIYANLCKQTGKSATAVAVELNISRGTVSAWKNRGTTPQRDILQKIADYFDVTVDYLLNGEPTVSSQISNMDIIYPKIYANNPSPNFIRIPVLGRVAAGIPINAVEEIIGWEEVPEDWTRRGEIFALQIKGDSMEPRISEGDIVICRKQSDVKTNDIAIVIINGDDATCKKVVKHSDGITLISLNQKYPPMQFSNKEIQELPVSILGKVIELRAKF